LTSSIYDIPVTKITGEAASLSEFKGKVLLLVNVASKCGLTPQYEGLENLYERLRGQGLVVAGFPANDFKSQEPGTNDEIQSFCTLNYGVKFPMFGKIQVTGAEKHPLYASLIAAQPNAKGDPAGWAAVLKQHNIDANPAPEIQWNFEKFIIGRNGEVVARFAPNTAPDASELIAAVESELVKN
jgi:glutathione peroxidase